MYLSNYSRVVLVIFWCVVGRRPSPYLPCWARFGFGDYLWLGLVVFIIAYD